MNIFSHILPGAAKPQPNRLMKAGLNKTIPVQKDFYYMRGDCFGKDHRNDTGGAE